MKGRIEQIKRLIDEFGFLLVLIRAPRVIWRALKTKIATRYWGLFLGGIGKNVKISPGVIIHKPHKVFLGNNVIISEDTIIGTESKDGRLWVEDNVQINRLCFIDHSGDTIIGEGTLISEGVCILSHSHGYDPHQKSIGIPKRIGKNCWIGFRAIISENATYINDRVIVATGSLVTKSCEQTSSVYGGFPAKWLKSIETQS